MKNNILIINFDFENIEKYLDFFEINNPNIHYKVLSFKVDEIKLKNIFYAKLNDKIYSNEIENYKYKEVYILSNKNIILPKNIYYTIFTNKLKAIWRIYEKEERYIRKIYEPFKKKKSQNIIVFPGPVIPLSLGSHQRVFSFILLMNMYKIYTDILITAGNEKDNKIIKTLLLSIAPNVFVYKNTKRKYPFFIRYRKKIERFIFNKLGKVDLLSDLYSERKFIKPTVSAKRTLARIVEEKNYINIIINYAWMIDVIDNIKNKSKYNFICDTHDVQFIRNKTQNAGTKRLFVNFNKEKRLEIEQLSEMDRILAISKSDYDAFYKEKVLREKILKVVPPFEYIYNNKLDKINKNYVFGFIGTNMKANLVSLNHILNDIWPKIISKYPKAKLKIAGSIGNNKEIDPSIKLDDSIEVLGYVNSLKLFYRDIDFLINPVIVKGGLNFKNVECIMFGKILITNKMGKESLIDELKIFQKPEDIIDFLDKSTEENLIEYRKICQQKALLEFSDSNFISNIRKVLK